MFAVGKGSESFMVANIHKTSLWYSPTVLLFKTFKISMQQENHHYLLMSWLLMFYLRLAGIAIVAFCLQTILALPHCAHSTIRTSFKWNSNAGVCGNGYDAHWPARVTDKTFTYPFRLDPVQRTIEKKNAVRRGDYHNKWLNVISIQLMLSLASKHTHAPEGKFFFSLSFSSPLQSVRKKGEDSVKESRRRRYQ